MKSFIRENSLSLAFGLLFVLALLGQSLAGQHSVNADRLAHGEHPLSWHRYISSPDFGGAVMENWQSEFLQFALFIAATIWLVQKGSNESKALGEVGRESDDEQQVGGYARPSGPAWAKAGGLRLRVYENSLLLAMFLVFLGTWFGQSLNNWRVFNDEQRAHGGSTLAWSAFIRQPSFWEKTLENWQSEFLAIGTMAVFTVFLRQRGSPESKPVGAPHAETGSSG